MTLYRILSSLLLLFAIVTRSDNFAQQAGHGNHTQAVSDNASQFVLEQGAIIRGDKSVKRLALVFTGDEFAEGASTIIRVLKFHRVKASFFFTGRFYRNAAHTLSIHFLQREGHYLGAHSNDHLLYCDWSRRDQLLVTREEFENDLSKNYEAMQTFGISKDHAHYFLPPFEWYNQTISEWTRGIGLQLVNFTPGTRSNADYTTPTMKNYVSSDAIMANIRDYEANDPHGLNGFILLTHIGVGPQRADKFYDQLDDLITWLKTKHYELVRIDQLFQPELLKQ